MKIAFPKKKVDRRGRGGILSCDIGVRFRSRGGPADAGGHGRHGRHGQHGREGREWLQMERLR